jgi:hypothetical protein
MKNLSKDSLKNFYQKLNKPKDYEVGTGPFCESSQEDCLPGK